MVQLKLGLTTSYHMSSYGPHRLVPHFRFLPGVLGYLIVFGKFWYRGFEYMGSVCWVLGLGFQTLFWGQNNWYSPIS